MKLINLTFAVPAMKGIKVRTRGMNFPIIIVLPPYLLYWTVKSSIKKVNPFRQIYSILLIA